MPSRRIATVETTVTPRRRASMSSSTTNPRARASSIMLRHRTKGSSISATWIARRSVRSRFLASPTTTTARGASSRRMSRVTRSSSEEGTNEAAPGVSTTVTRRPAMCMWPVETSTVVPG